MTDAGMCGDYDSILGMAKEEPVRRFLQKTPGRPLEPASGRGHARGVAVDVDDRTGLAHGASRPCASGRGCREARPPSGRS